ncbi:MAG: phosphopentomutase [Clostridia bacterium]|nr:phosphopentomutase [Clostridia bacterium]
MHKKVILIVLDGAGVGDAPDAAAFGDLNANTLRSAVEIGRPNLPCLSKLGLARVPGTYLPAADTVAGAYGRCTQRSSGKDTTSGHWEMAGLLVESAFPTFPDGFPPAFVTAFEQAVKRRCIGNCVASGTEIIERLGEAHMRSGDLILYTSADSVFQIAAHEAVVPPDELWRICTVARGMLTGPLSVSRVIARPFLGSTGAFVRTGNRRDYSVAPPSDTLLDILAGNGYDVMGIGKIEDIFAHRGLTFSDHASGNTACMESMFRTLDKPVNGLVFVNLVDFDMLYGHRRDPHGFAAALETVDRAIPDLLSRMGADDLLVITADHGCDPGYRGTDHTRERVPLLVYRHGISPVDLGTRETLADIAATVLDMFSLPQTLAGTSFYQALLSAQKE